MNNLAKVWETNEKQLKKYKNILQSSFSIFFLYAEKEFTRFVY